MEAYGYIDIHCHILPGVDDGAATLADSLEMAAMASADGIRTIVATPHASHEYPALPTPELFQRVAELQAEIDRLHIPLRILPGADVHITETLPEQILHRQVLTVADAGRYLLLELPHDVYIPLDNLMDQLHSMGTSIILTHPERNRALQANVAVLLPLIQKGCLLQVTAGSLLGEFGSHVKSVTRQLLEHRFVHFVATDAHSPRRRKPLLHEAYKSVCALAGKGYAEQIFKQFPSMAIQGKRIDSPSPRPIVRSFLHRVFG